jgi:hypothetical protein
MTTGADRPLLSFYPLGLPAPSRFPPRGMGLISLIRTEFL